MFSVDMNDKKTHCLRQSWLTKRLYFSGAFILFILVVLVFVSSPVYAASCKIPKSYYKNVSCTSDSRYFLAVKDTGEPVALLNKQGKKSADLFTYEQVLAHKMRDGLLPVRKKGKVGYINGKGVVAIPLVYDSLGGTNWARSFNNNRAVVKKAGRWGVINTANRAIVPFSSSISSISDYSAGEAEMVKSRVTFIVDTNGKTRNAHSSRNTQGRASATSSSLGRAPQPSRSRQNNNTQNNKQSTVTQTRAARANTTRVKKSTEISLPDSRINQLLADYKLIPPVVSLPQNEPVAKPFVRNKESSSSISNDSSINAISQINNPSILNASVMTPTYQSKQADNSASNMPSTATSNMPFNSSQGIKLFPKQNAEGKWGFDDVNGVNMITYSFDEVMPFSSGLAGVKLANNWGFINDAGDLIIPFRFNEQGVRSSDNETYKGMPPFMFLGEKAWIGSLRNGKKLCIDKEGVNVTCDE